MSGACTVDHQRCGALSTKHRQPSNDASFAEGRTLEQLDQADAIALLVEQLSVELVELTAYRRIVRIIVRMGKHERTIGILDAVLRQNWPLN